MCGETIKAGIFSRFAALIQHNVGSLSVKNVP